MLKQTSDAPSILHLHFTVISADSSAFAGILIFFPSARNALAFWGTLQCGRTVKGNGKNMSQESISLVYKWMIFFLEGRNQEKMVRNFKCIQDSVVTVVDVSEGQLYFLQKK